MKNEPVAYVDNVWINRPDLAMDLGIGQMFSRCQLSDHQIPLYTHPVKEPSVCIGYWDYKTGAFHKVLTELQQKRIDEGFLQPVYTAGMLRVKELTDDEIEEIGKQYGIKTVYKYAYYEFAKAILRKAQEK